MKIFLMLFCKAGPTHWCEGFNRGIRSYGIGNERDIYIILKVRRRL